MTRTTPLLMLALATACAPAPEEGDAPRAPEGPATSADAAEDTAAPTSEDDTPEDVDDTADPADDTGIGFLDTGGPAEEIPEVDEVGPGGLVPHDELADVEPQRIFTFMPDSNGPPDSGYAFHHAGAVGSIDAQDRFLIDVDLLDSGADHMALELMLVCDAGAQVMLTSAEGFVLAGPVTCNGFNPLDAEIEDGEAYVVRVMPTTGAVASYELYAVASTVF